MQSSKLIIIAFTLLPFLCSAEQGFPLASELRVVIESPFPYAQALEVPENIKREMDLEADIPRLTFDYFEKANAFESVFLGEKPTSVDGDLYVKGEILHAFGGNGAARYFGGIAGAGRSYIVVGVKIYDKKGLLIHEGEIAQVGTKATNVFTAWSNRRNIESAVATIPSKVLPMVLAGDIDTQEGVIKAVSSNYSLAIRWGAQASVRNEFFKVEAVTDAMQDDIQTALEIETEDSYYIDSIAWCSINLGKSGNRKYEPILQDVLDSKAHKKIKKHAKKSLKMLAGS